MYRNNKYRFEIDIELDNGVYFFNPISATGKTNLYKKLKKLSWKNFSIMILYQQKGKTNERK